MITFQFDECFSDKKLLKACNEEGLAAALRLPRALIEKEDPELLAILLQRPHPFVTLDRALPHEHAAHIPVQHPGILIVNFSRQSTRTITTTAAGKILRSFKHQLPDWHERSLQGSIVEITEKNVEVWHVAGSKLVRDTYLEYDTDDWMTQLGQHLQQNALRAAREP